MIWLVVFVDHKAKRGRIAMRICRRVLAVFGGWAAASWTAEARAGMPSPVLTDWAEIRFETLSFFAVVVLLSAALICWLWNGLAKDFTALPRLKYRRALAMVVLLGLFLALVLTMIAGTRELLTPGAWQKQGLLYKVSAPPPSSKLPETPKTPDSTVLPRLSERFQHLYDLQQSLWAYAAKHDGRFPEKDATPEIDAALWQWPCMVGMRYLYVPGRRVDQKSEETHVARVLVYEPDVYDGDRLVLRTDGKIVSMPAGELHQQLSEKP